VRVAFVTSYPGVQRVGLFNELARRAEVEFRVFYLRRMPYGRLWQYSPTIEHDHRFIREVRVRRHLYLSPRLLSALDAFAPILTVITQYTTPGTQQLMYRETLRRRPWVLWAERPVMRYVDAPVIRPEALRRLAHRVAFVPIRLGAREIWGVGTMACAEYGRIVGAERPVRNVPHFSDLSRFIDAGQGRQPGGRVRFLFSGALSFRKGADLVLAAVERLLSEGKELELHVLGAGQFSASFEALRSRWPSCVTLHGFHQVDEVPPYYGNADVLLFPSRFDAWGMTLPEGMAAGLLPISSREAGAAVDMIRDGDDGLLISPGAESLIAAMRTCLALTPEALTDRGTRAREVATRYGHRAGAATLLAELQRVG
jgi:glycosyltransferase involved in cell wall biosynthesis